MPDEQSEQEKELEVLRNRPEEWLAEDLAEQVVLHFLQPNPEEEVALQELNEYLKSLELHPPFLRSDDLRNKKRLGRQLVGLPSFLRAVQNQRDEVLECLSMAKGPDKQVHALSIWGQESIF